MIIDIIIPRPAINGINIVSSKAYSRFASMTIYSIIAVSAKDVIRTGIPINLIVARTARKRIGSAIPIDGIVARLTIGYVSRKAPAKSDKKVISISSIKGIDIHE